MPETNDFFHPLMSLNSLQSQVCSECDKLRGVDICGFKCLFLSIFAVFVHVCLCFFYLQTVINKYFVLFL